MPLNDFHKNKLSKDNHKSYCKQCQKIRAKKYYTTIDGFLTRIFYRQQSTTRKNKYDQVEYTLDEFIEFAKNSMYFIDLFIQYEKSGFKKELAPSFDRKNDYKGYSFENFNKWMTWQENRKKGQSDRKNGINNKRSKAVIAINKQTLKETEFYSMHHASRVLNINYVHIYRCCHNIRKSSGGYYFKFKSC